ncbi:hypothetical protein C1646_756903 [Rhizophagus diaphanus]|nr:hypothetical protein C1646_756903 [Rhizophagus diaphanus] [Rhizophagus sp. MUCL 43196]
MSSWWISSTWAAQESDDDEEEEINNNDDNNEENNDDNHDDNNDDNNNDDNNDADNNDGKKDDCLLQLVVPEKIRNNVLKEQAKPLVSVTQAEVSIQTASIPLTHVSNSSGDSSSSKKLDAKTLDQYPNLYREFSSEDFDYYGINDETLCPLCKLDHDNEKNIDEETQSTQESEGTNAIEEEEVLEEIEGEKETEREEDLDAAEIPWATSQCGVKTFRIAAKEKNFRKKPVKEAGIRPRVSQRQE